MRIRTAWRLAVLVLAAAVGSGCVTHRAYDNMKRLRDDWQAKAEAAYDENQKLRNLLEEKGERVTELSDLVRMMKENDELHRKREEAIREIFRGLEGVEAMPGGGRLSSAVFFRSGKAELTANGEKVLGEIARRLASPEAAQFNVSVQGHTDTDPVVVHKNEFPMGNLQLSGARAMNVAHFLSGRGVAAQRVSFSGYGEYRPIVPNTTAAGKAKNRRVEVLLSAPGEDAIPAAMKALFDERAVQKKPMTDAGKGQPDAEKAPDSGEAGDIR